MINTTTDQLPLWDADCPYLRFVIKRHHATSLHYDFRLEAGGVLISWVLRVPPSLDPRQFIVARRVNDHDPEWILSERRIPRGFTGAGPTLVWDYGHYAPLKPSDCRFHSHRVIEELENGRLDFELDGKRFKGSFRLEKSGADWRLLKLEDQHATKIPPDWDFLSVITGRSLEQI